MLARKAANSVSALSLFFCPPLGHAACNLPADMHTFCTRSLMGLWAGWVTRLCRRGEAFPSKSRARGWPLSQHRSQRVWTR